MFISLIYLEQKFNMSVNMAAKSLKTVDIDFCECERAFRLTECASVAEVGEHLRDLVLRDVARELEHGSQRVLVVVFHLQDIVNARDDSVVHVHTQRLQAETRYIRL